MKLALLILVGFILEIFVWIGVGDLVGSMWYVFFWFLIAGFIGMSMVRKHATGIMPQMQQMQMGMADPNVTGNLPKILAGFFLLLPGLISDVFAVLILIPAVQNLLKASMMKVMMNRQQAMMQQMMGNMGGMNNAQGANPFADLMRQMQQMQGQDGRDSTIIDGEAREVMPEAKRVEMKDVNKL